MSKKNLPFKMNMETKNVSKWLGDLKDKELPRAISDTMNHMANGSRKDLQNKMREVFYEPSTFTLNMFSVKFAKPKDLTASIGDRVWAGKGNLARDYLMPEIQGGIRPMKGSEKLMMAISGGRYWVPGPDMKETANGKVSKGEIVKILSRLQLFNKAGYRANFNKNTDKSIRMRQQRKNARGSDNEYFIGYHKDGSPMGIFKYTGKKRAKRLEDRAHFLIKFVDKKPTYEKSFPVPEIVDEYVEKNFERIAWKEIAKSKSKRK